MSQTRPHRILALAAATLVAASCTTSHPRSGPPARPDFGAEAARLRPALVETRRDIHRHPELSGGEGRTASLVAQRLGKLGLEVRTGVGGHGVVGVLRGGRPGPVVAYRADMDAFPGDEPADRQVRSEVPGVHHVCGHDLHVAVGLGIAEVLARHRRELPGTVVFLFQPAEETLEGAAAMLAAGALDSPRPEAIFAVHSFPLPVGTIAEGAAFAGLDSATIELSGAAATAQTAQALEAALLGLGTVAMPSSLDDFERLLADLRRAGGPLEDFVFVTAASQVEPGRATVHVSFKASSDAAYPQLRERMAVIAREVAGAGMHELRFPSDPFPGLFGDPAETAAAATTLRRELGSDRVQRMEATVPIAGEDFALFLREAPGAMFFLGVANRERGILGIPHLPSFDLDEEALVVGTQAMSAVLWDRLAHGGPPRQGS